MKRTLCILGSSGFVKIVEDLVDGGHILWGNGIPAAGPERGHVGAIKVRPLAFVDQVVILPNAFLFIPQHLPQRGLHLGP